MARTENKTQPHGGDVAAFLNAVENPIRRADGKTVCALMERVTGEAPRLWGDSIIGFGRYHYRYASGREGDWMLTGFSPRKANLSLYIMPGYGEFDAIMDRLGKHKRGKSCLYVNKLADIDMDVLEELVDESVKLMRTRYETG